MEFHELRYFLALCETLNFTRAAEQCNVSQPSLTRAIKNLEYRLGGPLIRRERSNTHLTELGRMMRPYFHEVFAQMEHARKQASDYIRLSETNLSVGLMCTIGPIRLVELFARFKSENPGVTLYLRDGRARDLEDALAKGELDVAVYGLPGGIDEDRFHSLPLLTERFVIAISPTHHFASRNTVRLKDLHQQAYLSRANCEFAEHVRAIAKKNGVEPLRPYLSERDDWIQCMVLAGLGFTFIPEFAVTIPGLVTRPLIEPEITRTIDLVTVRGRPHSPAVGAFVREAKRHRWVDAPTSPKTPSSELAA